jgi:hypothetical protein
MNRVAFCAFLALAALTAGTLAQSKPSFAGHWTVVIDTAAQSATARANPGWTDGYRWYGGITVPAVLTTTVTRDGERTDSTATWSLDAAGNLIIESTSGGRTEPPRTTKMTYKKAPGL